METAKINIYHDREFQAEGIDNLFDDLFPNNVINTAGIDNLFDDLFENSSGRSGFPAVLECLEEKPRENILHTRLFHPTPNEVTFTPSGQATECVMPINRFRCIRIAGMPNEFPEIEEKCPIELIDTIDNNKYQVHVPTAQKLENGLFGFSTRDTSQYKYYFFPYTNIKFRCLKQFLGEILVEKKLINDKILQDALQELSSLKQSKLGKILAKQTSVNHAHLEHEIQKIYRGNINKLKVGEILVSSGLVNEEQVNKALATQSHLKKKKIGQYLIEKGILKEEEVFHALAEKFRIPYVDLSQETIPEGAIELLPRELILKLQILPLSFKDSVLTVATMIPDVPAIKELIVKHTKHQNIKLVLTCPSLLRAAIKQLLPQ